MARSGLFFLAILTLVSSISAQVDNDDDLVSSDQCPRYSVHEFYLSLFLPVLEQRLTFVEKLVRYGSDAIEELLVKMEEKKGNNGDLIKHCN
jgi:hypothetical protein